MNEYHIHTYIQAIMHTFIHIYINASEDLANPALKSRKSHSEWSDTVLLLCPDNLSFEDEGGEQ